MVHIVCEKCGRKILIVDATVEQVMSMLKGMKCICGSSDFFIEKYF